MVRCRVVENKRLKYVDLFAVEAETICVCVRVVSSNRVEAAMTAPLIVDDPMISCL